MKEWRKECQELRIIPDPVALFHAARRLALSLGQYDVFTFVLSVPGSDSATPTLLAYGGRDYPEWHNALTNADLRRRDPIVKMAKREMMAVNWDEPGLKALHPEWVRTLPPGLLHGISQPTRGLGTDFGIATLARRSGPIEEEEQNEIELKLHILGHKLHAQMMQIIHDSGDLFTPLNNEELEIIRWSSLGKQAEDISRLMNLTKNMVTARTVALRGKLKAYTTAHAVIRAYTFGLIPPD